MHVHIFSMQVSHSRPVHQRHVECIAAAAAAAAAAPLVVVVVAAAAGGRGDRDNRHPHGDDINGGDGHNMSYGA